MQFRAEEYRALVEVLFIVLGASYWVSPSVLPASLASLDLPAGSKRVCRRRDIQDCLGSNDTKSVVAKSKGS